MVAYCPANHMSGGRFDLAVRSWVARAFAYASQLESPWTRKISAVQKIRRQLAGLRHWQSQSP